jgi:hypothetical protein
MPKIGNSSLKQLVDNVLQHIYPTVANADASQEPTSVTVYGITKDTEPVDSRKNTHLDTLKFSDLVQVLAEYKFKVTRYNNGSAGPSSVYSVVVQSTDTTAVGSLSVADIVTRLGQNPVTVADGQSKSYTITGTTDTPDQNPENPDLTKPIAPFTAKYVFLLKKLYKFTVTAVDAAGNSSGPSTDYTVDGNKTFNE